MLVALTSKHTCHKVIWVIIPGGILNCGLISTYHFQYPKVVYTVEGCQSIYFQRWSTVTYSTRLRVAKASNENRIPNFLDLRELSLNYGRNSLCVKWYGGKDLEFSGTSLVLSVDDLGLGSIRSENKNKGSRSFAVYLGPKKGHFLMARKCLHAIALVIIELCYSSAYCSFWRHTLLSCLFFSSSKRAF